LQEESAEKCKEEAAKKVKEKQKEGYKPGQLSQIAACRCPFDPSSLSSSVLSLIHSLSLVHVPCMVTVAICADL